MSDSENKNGASGLRSIVNSDVSRRTFLKGGLAATAVVGLGVAAVNEGPLAFTTSTQPTSVDPFAAQQITLNVY